MPFFKTLIDLLNYCIHIEYSTFTPISVANDSIYQDCELIQVQFKDDNECMFASVYVGCTTDGYYFLVER